MTTPTREQVIEWAKEAGLSFDDGWIFYTPKRPSLPEAEMDAFVAAMNAAHTAGRDQGLREAAELMREIGRLLKGNATPTTEESALAIESLLKRAAAIEQLRVK